MRRECGDHKIIKLLAGKQKENSQIFNEYFYLPLYLPLFWGLNGKGGGGGIVSFKVKTEEAMSFHYERWRALSIFLITGSRSLI